MTASASVAPGVIAAADFVGAPGARVFTVRTTPVDGAERRLIVCPPFGAEGPRNYKREVELARLLARRGVETIRFHYRGSGQSDDVSDFGFDTMLSDARTVDGRFGDDRPTTWMGTRLGGLVAASVASSSLILWDPVLDPIGHFREILRARVFSAFRSDDPGTAPKTDLVRHLESEGQVDLLGYLLPDRLRRQVCDAPPLRDLDVAGRRFLLLEMRRRGTPRNEANRLAEVWRASGAEVNVEAVPIHEPWWYGARAGASAQESAEANDRLLGVTADFVTDHDRVAP